MFENKQVEGRSVSRVMKYLVPSIYLCIAGAGSCLSEDHVTNVV